MRTREVRQILQALGLLSQLGFTIVVAILLGIGLGLGLGRLVGWPLPGLLLGVVLGVGGAGVAASGLVGQLLTPAELGGGSGMSPGSREPGQGGDPGEAIDPFPELIQSLRRWVLGLGLAVLFALLLAGFPRPVLAGYCVGWFLSLFTLDHIAGRARQIQLRPLSGGDAKIFAVRTFLFRWLVLIGVIVLASKVGASPVAAVAGLLLLQAAIVCRSIRAFLDRDPPSEDDPAG